MTSRKLAAVFAIVVGLILAGFGVYYATAPGAPEESVTENISIFAPPGATAAELSPRNFTVREGENVVLVVDNMDNITHSLAIPGIVVTPPIQPGQTIRVGFIPREEGVFALMQPVISQCRTYYECDLTGGNMTVLARLSP